MRFAIVLSILALIGSPILSARGKNKAAQDKHAGKFSDLAVTVTKVVSDESTPHTGDHHVIGAFVSVKNTGKGVICASFNPTLEAEFGLEYRGSLTKAPKMREMLPGEGAEGSYSFSVRDSVKPLQLILELEGRKIRCGVSNPTSWHDTLVSDEIRLDLHDLPILEVDSNNAAEPQGQAGNTSAAGPNTEGLLSSPVLLSPADGTVFSNYPRVTVLNWEPVRGAATYVVQVDIYFNGWASEGNGRIVKYIVQSVTGTSYSFQFAGAQPGRWRTWAVDSRGNEGTKSAWSGFRYTQ